ncbi:MAG: HD-GYP domain-containing protein [Syntrophomonas sp.]
MLKINKIWLNDLAQGLKRVLKEPKVTLLQNEEEFMITARTLLRVIDLIDHYTYFHSLRVAAYCEHMAREINLSAVDRKVLHHGALLHDIGKIGIGKAILCKNGPLSNEEWLIVKRHPMLGTEMLEHAGPFPEILSIVRHHHENYDGSGYPYGLAGEEIPYLARILDIADSFDAMTSQRPYHPTRSVNQAMEELERCAAKQFDPLLVPHFIRMIEKHGISVN